MAMHENGEKILFSVKTCFGCIMFTSKSIDFYSYVFDSEQQGIVKNIIMTKWYKVMIQNVNKVSFFHHRINMLGTKKGDI